MKQYTLAEMEDKYIGEPGTPERDAYEYELKMELLGRMIKATRKERNMTQEELGKVIGVNKSQISKLIRFCFYLQKQNCKIPHSKSIIVVLFCSVVFSVFVFSCVV